MLILPSENLGGVMPHTLNSVGTSYAFWSPYEDMDIHLCTLAEERTVKVQ